MFPTKSLAYLRLKISRRGFSAGERVLQDLIEEVLREQEGEQEGEQEDEHEEERGLQDSRCVGDQDQADVTLEISTRQEEPQLEEPRPGSSREPQLQLQEDFVKLSTIFPDISPVYLQDIARKIAGDSEALQVFVEETWQRKSSLPSRMEWERGEEMKVKLAEVKRLKCSDFLWERE